MSRSRSAIKTWMGSLIFMIVTMATAMVTTPIIVGALGNARFGVVRSLSEAFGYLTLIAQGVTLAMVPRLVATFGVGDREGASRSLSAGFRLYAAASLVIVIVGLAATPAIGLLIRGGPALRGETQVGWLIGLAVMPLIVATPLRILLEVDHKGFVVQLVQTAQALVGILLTIVLVLSGWGVAGSMLGLLAGSLVFHVVLALFAFAGYPDLIGRSLRATPSTDDWRAMRSLSGPTVLALLSEKIGVLSDSLVLSAVLGPAAATTLYVTQRLIEMGRMVLGAVSGAIWPGLSQLYSRGDLRTFNLRLVELTRLVSLLGVAGMIPAVAYNGHFLLKWMGPKFVDGGLAIAALAGFNGMLLTLLGLFAIPFVTTGRVSVVVPASVASSVINIVASVICSWQFGPIGPLMGTAIGGLSVGAWYLPWQLRRTFGTPIRGLVRAVASPIPWGVGYWFLASWASRSHQPVGWLGLIAEMGAWVIAFLILGTFAILGPEDRSLWKGRLIDPLIARL